MWLQIAQAVVMMIVSHVLTAITAPKPEKPKPGTLEVPTTDENKPIGVVFGSVLIKDANVMWSGDASTKPITTRAGKK